MYYAAVNLELGGTSRPPRAQSCPHLIPLLLLRVPMKVCGGGAFVLAGAPSILVLRCRPIGRDPHTAKPERACCCFRRSITGAGRWSETDFPKSSVSTGSGY